VNKIICISGILNPDSSLGRMEALNIGPVIMLMTAMEWLTECSKAESFQTTGIKFNPQIPPSTPQLL